MQGLTSKSTNSIACPPSSCLFAVQHAHHTVVCLLASWRPLNWLVLARKQVTQQQLGLLNQPELSYNGIIQSVWPSPLPPPAHDQYTITMILSGRGMLVVVFVAPTVRHSATHSATFRLLSLACYATICHCWHAKEGEYCCHVVAQPEKCSVYRLGTQPAVVDRSLLGVHQHTNVVLHTTTTWSIFLREQQRHRHVAHTQSGLHNGTLCVHCI